MVEATRLLDFRHKKLIVETIRCAYLLRYLMNSFAERAFALVHENELPFV